MMHPMENKERYKKWSLIAKKMEPDYKKANLHALARQLTDRLITRYK
jgi:hypothetical protein